MSLISKTRGFFYINYLRLRCLRWRESSAWASVNGLCLYYVVRGPEQGRPVLLIHGNGGSHKSLETQSLELALAGYRVYSPDSRGQGANPPLQEYHYSDMAEDMFCFIREFNLNEPAVFGWSDGGIIALMMEMSHPSSCALIVCCGANLCPDCGEGFEDFKQWVLQDGSPLAMMMLSEPDIKPSELSAIKCPVLVAAGTEDLISVEHTKLIADSIPSSELALFEGEDHRSYIKRSPKIGRKMLDFFNRHYSGRN